MLNDIIEVASRLFEFVETFQKADADKRKKIARYFSKISSDLHEVANQLNTGTVPYDKLSGLRDLSYGLQEAIGEEIEEGRAIELANLLSSSISVNTDSISDSVRVAKEAAGKFEALAFRIEYSDSRLQQTKPRVKSAVLLALLAGGLSPLAYWHFRPFSLRTASSLGRSGSEQAAPNFKTKPSGEPSIQSHRRINPQGLNIIQSFEPLYLEATQDPDLGELIVGYSTRQGVIPGMKITKKQAVELLKSDLGPIEAQLEGMLKVPTNDDQFSALVSLASNIGIHTVRESTLLKYLNAQDYSSAANQFLTWQKLPTGINTKLSRRRLAERALFLGEEYKQYLDN